MSASSRAVEWTRTAARAAADMKGENIVALDVSGQLALTDVFLLISGSNERQVDALVDAVEDALRLEHGAKRARREGHGSGRWELLDFSEIVIHVFHQEEREFYALERLWRDSPVIPLDLED